MLLHILMFQHSSFYRNCQNFLRHLLLFHVSFIFLLSDWFVSLYFFFIVAFMCISVLPICFFFLCSHSGTCAFNKRHLLCVFFVCVPACVADIQPQFGCQMVDVQGGCLTLDSYRRIFSHLSCLCFGPSKKLLYLKLELRIYTCVMALKYGVICSSHHLIRFRFLFWSLRSIDLLKSMYVALSLWWNKWLQLFQYFIGSLQFLWQIQCCLLCQ